LAGHVGRWVRQGIHKDFGHFFSNSHLEDQKGDGKITLGWILGR